MAMPQSRAELNQIIKEQVDMAIGAPQIAAIGRLVDSSGSSTSSL